MLYSCIHMATVGLKGLRRVGFNVSLDSRNRSLQRQSSFPANLVTGGARISAFSTDDLADWIEQCFTSPPTRYRDTDKTEHYNQKTTYKKPLNNHARKLLKHAQTKALIKLKLGLGTFYAIIRPRDVSTASRIHSHTRSVCCVSAAITMRGRRITLSHPTGRPNAHSLINNGRKTTTK